MRSVTPIDRWWSCAQAGCLHRWSRERWRPGKDRRERMRALRSAPISLIAAIRLEMYFGGSNGGGTGALGTFWARFPPNCAQHRAQGQSCASACVPQARSYVHRPPITGAQRFQSRATRDPRRRGYSGNRTASTQARFSASEGPQLLCAEQCASRVWRQRAGERSGADGRQCAGRGVRHVPART